MSWVSTEAREAQASDEGERTEKDRGGMKEAGIGEDVMSDGSRE